MYRSSELLTKQAQVLAHLAVDAPRIGDLARRLGTTTRTVHLILADLVAQGVVVRERVGRRARYRLAVPVPAPMRDALEEQVAQLLTIVRATDRTLETADP